ncbi:hypothetical protein NLX71_26070 [Paenibacillus sp. MZ04-78.2]|uniref:LamG-like jellyroll fold domain-containing protein n=1 Tax=Paenibacillus sp. MZ04-78.2 TaxID=2962034 RepID=UPI0020B8E9CB|nr:LamG-like jellyroll fold domain-containing protein [Paenibacillus sp. MZ04-78.2]MCP3776709.1 hypothetical protein [Paenibacillus sp. MZ04-78.2]
MYTLCNLGKILMYFNAFLIMFILPLEKANAYLSASYSESSYNYDSSGRLINVQLPTGQGREYIYDANGNITRNFASLSFDGTKQISLNNIAVNTKPGGKNTVEFWMYWTGTEGVMPFSWDGPYDLWFSGGYFGFNTGESNILGISSADLKNRWVHIAATFYNGVPDAVNNELYINGVKQNLAPVLGKTTSSVTVTSNAVVSGASNNNMYRFIGKIGTMRIWNHALSATEIQANMYKLYKEMEAGLVGYWKLGEIPSQNTSLAFEGTKQVSLNNIAANTASGAKNTVEFWMYWDGTEGGMPFSWDGMYNLWFSGGYFGFNTGESNVLGIPSANLKNKWTHVAATFFNGVPDATNNELYIDGIKQNLTAGQGTTTASRNVASSAMVSGSIGTPHYRFNGRIGELRIWNYPLSQSEVQSNMYKVITGMEPGVAGYWKLSDRPLPNTSLAFEGTKQVSLNNISVNTASGAKNTVEFWMYWDGTEGGMPFSWDGMYNLWFSGGYFGFNTGESNVLGIPSANLKNKWTHVAATFFNGVPDATNNELYIDGIKQNLTAGQGITTASRNVASSAMISGSIGTPHYRFNGRIGELRIWNYPLSQSEVQSNMYKVIAGMEPGVTGYWKLSDRPLPNTSLAFEGTKQVNLNNIAVNTASGAKNTVEFWMNWDGTEGGMPFSWDGMYDLWFSGGYFGFNTGESNVLGIPSANLKNKWTHVAATFFNGVPDATNNELYIDGIKQNLTAGQGITTASRTVASSAMVSGSIGTPHYRFNGRIGELRIWNYPLSSSSIQENMFRNFSGKEKGLVKFSRPNLEKS